MPIPDYYHDHAAAYFERTAHLDPGRFLAPLVRELPPGARVLDVGCGSGRDLRWLKACGFRPTGLERSPTLAALARRHGGCPVVAADFETHDFAGCDVDAVLLVGALVHLPHGRLGPVLGRILDALDARAPAGGWLYLSLKRGEGRRRGRCRQDLLPLAGRRTGPAVSPPGPGGPPPGRIRLGRRYRRALARLRASPPSPFKNRA